MFKLKLMKYILLCPSDIYSMIQSLQTGMSKTLWTHIRLPLKDKGHLLTIPKQYVSVFLFKGKCFSNLSIIQCLKIVNADQFILLEV